MKKLCTEYKILISSIAVVLIGCTAFCCYAEFVEGRSFQSKFFEWSMEVVLSSKFKKIENVYRKISKSEENFDTYEIPERYIKRYDLEVYDYEGMDICVFNRDAASGEYIIYFHGGAYVDKPLIYHWWFLNRLAEKTDSVVIMPLYLRAPNYQWEDSYEKSLGFYEEAMRILPADKTSLMGDSSGGAYALSLSVLAREKGLPETSNLVMISPWVDMTMENPEIEKYQELDPMVVAYAAKIKGEQFAGDTPLDYYILSPINADLTGLPKMTIFTGTHEVIYPDSKRFKEVAESQGVEINYFEYEYMNHVFVLFPIPEAGEALEQISDIMLND